MCRKEKLTESYTTILKGVFTMCFEGVKTHAIMAF